MQPYPISLIIKDVDQRRKTKHKQDDNRASSIGFPCRRFLCYSILRWEDNEETDQYLQLIFDEGHKQEHTVKLDLQKRGVELFRCQELVSFPRYRLAGHIEGIYKYRCDRLFEIKSVSDHFFPKVNSINDFLGSDFPWHNCYPYQVAVYLKGLRLNHGLFILKNKNNGQLKGIPFTLKELKYLVAEAFWKCEQVNGVVDFVRDMLKGVYDIEDIADFSKKGDRDDIREIREEACQKIEDVLPERIVNLKTCGCCPFQHICLPDEIRQDQVKLYTESSDFIEKLARREFLGAGHSEWAALEREVKAVLKQRKEEHFFVADGNKIAFEVFNGKQMKITMVQEKGLP